MNFNGKYKLKKIEGDIETHEVFLDNLARRKAEELGLSEKRLELKIKDKVIYAIFGLFFAALAFLFFKTFYLQIFEGKDFAALAESNKAHISLVRPERGVIYGKNLKKLVSNFPAYDLVCDKRDFYQQEESYFAELEIISQILDEDFNELKNRFLSSESSQFLVQENISHQGLLVLETRSGDFLHCAIEKNVARDYYLGSVFSPIIGYMGKINKEELKNVEQYTITDYIGKTGLERAYESYLRGEPGHLEIVRDAYGLKRGDNFLSQPKEGYSLVLNIDEDLQEKLYNALENSIKNVGSKKGAAVALDPRTGAVLALVSYPSFDNNIFSQKISSEEFNLIQNNPNQPFFNRVLGGQYAVGSGIKPFIAYGALQEEIISPTKLINDPGYILVPNQYNPEIVYRFGGVEPHGLVDMREAIAVSSNIYFYTVGGGYGNQKGLGPTKIKEYLSLFGWGQTTGVDIPGEAAGFIPSPEWKKQTKGEGWWDGDTYNLSIGQSDLRITPLQVALAYSAIANGGTLYKPQIVQKIIDNGLEESDAVKEFHPEIIKENFLDLEDLQVVKEGMRQAVTSGSATLLSSLPIKAAAKTGTAETSKAKRYNAWVSAFAPYENPEIVLTVLVEEVPGLGAAAVPVANETLNWYFTRK